MWRFFFLRCWFLILWVDKIEKVVQEKCKFLFGVSTEKRVTHFLRKNHYVCYFYETLVTLCKNRRFKKRNNSKSFIWKKNIFYKFFLHQIRRLFQEDIVCWTNFSLPKVKFLNLKSSWQLAKKKVNNKKFGFEKKKILQKVFFSYKTFHDKTNFRKCNWKAYV